MADLDSPLVSSGWLVQRLHDPSVRVIEVSWDPDPAGYHAGHIPGAVWWWWKEALWDDNDREFATPAQMARRLQRIGVAPATTLVIYGDPVQFGAYAFWVLSMCGHPHLRLLNGGKTAWTKEGRPLSKETPQFQPAAYAEQAGDRSSRVGRDDVRAHLHDQGRLLLDVRSAEEYRGERVSPPPSFDHGAERSGRIPGAVHLFFRELLHADDTFRTAAELRSRFQSVGLSGDDPRELVAYCRLSHRATLAWFALTFLLGYDSAKVYDGSWSEWGSIVGFPIEK